MKESKRETAIAIARDSASERERERERERLVTFIVTERSLSVNYSQ